MPTFHDPLADAAEASEAMRGLAHASRVFEQPADTYTVFGDLTAAMRSLRQVLDQLAATHLAHQDRAHHDDGDHGAGDRSALAAADELHQAGTLLDRAHDHLSAAFSHSGRIAWHPEPAQTGLDHDSASAAKTASAGTLTLTVWPDAPVGEHQRYAYRITDTTTGGEVEGRDLFTGAGQPVDPDRAIRDLVTFLGAAGEARQYALDQPDSEPEHAGLFPGWVAEAARTNADALTELAEDPAEPAAAELAGSEPARRWIRVVFFQGEEADQVLDVIDRDGTTAAIEHLKGWDYGEETIQAALENGYVYDEPPTGALDRVVTGDDGYSLTYNPFAGHVSLLREHHAPTADTLEDAAVVPAREAIPGIGGSALEPALEQASTARRAALGADKDWFAGPARTIGSAGRGLSL